MGYRLQRKVGETVIIDGRTTMTVADIGKGRVGVVFDAPDDVSIERGEKPRTVKLPQAPVARFMRSRAAS